MILFFIGLFVIIGCVSEAGLLDSQAKQISTSRPAIPSWSSKAGNYSIPAVTPRIPSANG